MIFLCFVNFPAPPITSPVSSVYDRNSCPYHCDGDREAAAINASLTWYSEPDSTPSPVGTPSYGPKDFEQEVAEEEEVDAAVLASLEHGSSSQPGFCFDDDDDDMATQLLNEDFDDEATQQPR